MIKNTLKGDELWMRCPECGDSPRNKNKAHLSVNVKTGLFNCLRCGYGGRLSAGQFLTILEIMDKGEITRLEGGEVNPLELQIEIEPGAGSSRRSMLDRFHVMIDGDVADVFEMRQPKPNVTIGHYFRSSQGKRFYGDHGINWPGSSSGLDYVSTPRAPLRIVEGPYDVTDRQTLAVFGLIKPRSLTHLKGHFVVLCPDGDVWTDRQKRYDFVNMVKSNLLVTKIPSPFIIALEILGQDQDPDEVPPEDRLRVERHEMLDFFQQIRDATS